MNEARPDPDALLRAAQREGRGRLKVFLGAAPGVGKTFEMLSRAAERRDSGVDVVVGVVETHGRAETAARLRGFEVLPRARFEHRGQTLEEMDIDAILARRPALVLVDELAHTNAPGSRHDKRWQDVEELRSAGLDVWSTLNIQHLESLNDLVASFTRVRVRETVPDRVLDSAEIEVVDIPPDELIERLREGKVYVPEEASRALGHFFSKSNLSALRELALRRAAQVVDTQILELVRAQALGGIWGSGERILVALSEQESAAELVRAGRRMADALHAPWTAVHIETPRSLQLGDGARKTLADVLHLATQLGAAVVTIPAASVTEGLKLAVAEARATQLFVGKTARSRWFELRHGSVVDRLVREMPGIAVHVLPLGNTPEVSRPGTGTATHWGMPRHYAIALALTGVVTALGSYITSLGSITNVALLYLLPVMAAATRFGLRPALATAVASSLAYNFFFIPPLYTFTISDPQNLITVLVLLGVAVVASQIASQTRDQAELSRASALQNSTLAGFARQLTGVSQRTELGMLLCGETARVFDAHTVLLRPAGGELAVEASLPGNVQIAPIEMAAAQWAFAQGRPAGNGSDTLTASEWSFHPIASGERVHAVIGLARRDAGRPVRPDQLPLLLSLLDQAGQTLERIALEEQMTDVAQMRERDRLRAALLSSVGHDLRTPLTAVVGLLAEIEPASAVQREQITQARGEAERVNRFVANLLDMVRIEAGALQQSLEPVDLAEAVSAAAHDLRRVLDEHPVEIAIPPSLPLVRIDPRLFHHCLINLIDNAAKHGPAGTPIRIAARRRPDGIEMDICDAGPGIPAGEELRIFDSFTRLDGSDRKGGTGLGLAIVKGFAEAMGLKVRAQNRPDHTGARFVIGFPAAIISPIAAEDLA
ncbi:sensor histidine kinase KdpD [Novosphingobium sp.]|uniref:sensor histidine kinase n=1 Tax=Novosphingobium sp. TaxID=1874826 RepID=UPI002626AEC3|nr:sensor histidine kinase KdpD [Novosphingobium sp.]